MRLHKNSSSAHDNVILSMKYVFILLVARSRVAEGVACSSRSSPQTGKCLVSTVHLSCSSYKSQNIIVFIPVSYTGMLFSLILFTVENGTLCSCKIFLICVGERSSPLLEVSKVMRSTSCGTLLEKLLY